MLSYQNHPASFALEDKTVNASNFFGTIVLRQLLALAFFSVATTALANLPGGGTNGPNVTLTDNGSTVTMANGIDCPSRLHQIQRPRISHDQLHVQQHRKFADA